MTWQEIAGWCIEILFGRFCLEVDSNQLFLPPVENKMQFPRWEDDLLKAGRNCEQLGR